MKLKTLNCVMALIGLYPGTGSAQQLITVDDYPVHHGFHVRDYPTGTGTPLLSWFDLWYVFPDHHIQQIGVLPTGNDIEISFRDDDNDDMTGYSVGHYIYPNVPWESASEICSSGLSCVTQLSPKPDDSEFVLIGFEAEYLDGDHHLRQLSIFESEGKLVVWFGDQYFDDDMAFRVDYSWVPRKNIVSMGHWGDGSSNGRIYAPSGELPNGPIVIQGFAANYLDDDHHVGRLAVSPDEVDLYDDDHDDAMRGQVKWLELAPDESGKPPPIDVKGAFEPPPLEMDGWSEPPRYLDGYFESPQFSFVAKP
ncbi:MAG TPA: hypothetical protein VM686_34215 [Polyangiaceae bacterium]|nr:hypothetical protein [Polyangiaceae bacterium]